MSDLANSSRVMPGPDSATARTIPLAHDQARFVYRIRVTQEILDQKILAENDLWNRIRKEIELRKSPASPAPDPNLPAADKNPISDDAAPAGSDQALPPDSDAPSPRRPTPMPEDNRPFGSIRADGTSLPRKRRCFYDDGSGLGMYFRLRIALIAGGLSQEDLAHACGLPTGQFRKNFQPTEKKWTGWQVKAAITHLLKPEVGLRSSGSALTEAAFRQEEFRGENACEEFLFWLQHGSRRVRDDYTAYLDKAKRLDLPEIADRRLLEDVEKFLSNNGPPNVMVIHSNPARHIGQAFGLTALAAQICDRAIADVHEKRASKFPGQKMQRRKTPYCYVPLSRSILKPPAEADQIPLNASSGPGAGDGKKSEHVVGDRPFRFGDVLAILKNFYAGTSKALDPLAPYSGKQIRKSIELIRAEMARQPAFLIFDGCSDHAGLTPALHRMIADDPMAALLDAILYPPTHTDEGPWQPGLFYHTRIVLLADGPCDEFCAFCCPPREMPLPDQGSLESFYADRYLRSTGQEMLDLVRSNITDERVVFLADTLIRRWQLKGADIPGRLAHVERCYGTPPGPEDLMAEIAQELARDPRGIADLMLIRFCAISDNGMRHTTLRRILRQWSLVLTEHAPVQLRLDQAEIDNAIGEAARRYPNLLVEGPDEKIPPLDAYTHPLEYPDSGPGNFPSVPAAPPIALNIRNSGLRAVIIDNLYETVDTDVIRAMHRLVAEEALTQQAVIDRHSPWTDPRNLRYLRRSIQGLYHGFRSIGPRRDNGPVDFTCIATTIPADPAEAFRWLYAVAFREQQEMPPFWEFSRRFRGDRIKADLLWVALTSPSQFHRTAEQEPPKQADVRAALHLLLTSSPSGPLTDRDALLLHDHCASLMRADQPTSSQDLADWVSHFERFYLPAMPTDDIPDHQHVVLQKADIDLDLYRRAAGARMDKLQLATPKTLTEALAEIARLAARVQSAIEIQRVPDCYKADINAIAEPLSGASPTRLALWCDLLCRHAERNAIEADRDDRGVELAHRHLNFLQAFLIFTLVERLRKTLFNSDPLGRLHIPSARSGFVSVRICLKLMRLFPEDKLWFFREARRQADQLTRYLARFPSHRANLLLLEATIARIAAGKSDLPTALRLLAEAERLLALMPGHNIETRLRLLYERQKVYTDLSDQRAVDQGNYLSAAHTDQRLIATLVGTHQLRHWYHVLKKFSPQRANPSLPPGNHVRTRQKT
jgi:hypothetical protein